MLKKNETELNGLEIAVIGMSGRFPGANSISEFWENIKNGVESVFYYSPDELKEKGLNTPQIVDENFVKSGVFLESREYFDASFFDYTPTQANVLDPQTRIFHECAWEALEDSGYDPETYEGLIGLFAGAEGNFNWEAKLYLSGMTSILGEFEAGHLIQKDSMCTLIAYKLNLKGPCFSLNTACSTSLVAIHLGCQALLNGECDIALAGGVMIADSQSYGYYYKEGMIYSPDGHCRAFDVDSKGTIGGEGAGIVVLKRYQDVDGDNVYAIIKGSAINNDGASKVGYTAPSVKGQVEVIKTALRMAEVNPETISYIETHGTGTVLGDAIELESLIQAFDTDKRGYCGIGSIKSNIGHLGVAAGVVGFIKTVLSLKHKLIPPTLNVDKPHPKIDQKNSPFYVNTQLKKWENKDVLLRAGISSLGIGGTNVHVILEEALETPRESCDMTEGYHLIALSAKSKPALAKLRENLTDYFKKNRDINIADAAYTLLAGRHIFPKRSVFISSSLEEAVELLTIKDSRKINTFELTNKKAPVVFLFSGLGSQYVNMGKDLYEHEYVFRFEMDRCFKLLNPLMNFDLKEILYPKECSVGSPCPPDIGNDCRDRGLPLSNPEGCDINRFEIAQLAIFTIEYALAKLLLSWGIKPQAVMGYSFGEYTAACISGIFSLSDALKLIVARGEIIQQSQQGKMTSVPIPKKDITHLLNDKLAIAIDNGSSCIISGAVDAVEDFEKKMKERRCICIPLNGNRAIHSPLMDTIIDEFRDRFENIEINDPTIPMISNVTGKWMSPGDVLNPEYWVNHLRETVHFSEGLKTLSSIKSPVIVEIGPGHDLSLIVQSCWGKNSDFQILNLLKHQRQNIPDHKFLLSKLGQLWLWGVEIDWSKFYSEQKRNRISLPTYPFERQYHWFNPAALQQNVELFSKSLGSSDGGDEKGKYCYYIPSWKHRRLSMGNRGGNVLCLLFRDETDFFKRFEAYLNRGGMEIIVVKKGKEFKKHHPALFEINPANIKDYDKLFENISSDREVPQRIFHAWNITERVASTLQEELMETLCSSFSSLSHLRTAIGNLKVEKEFKIIVLSNNVQEVFGEDIDVLKSVLLGPANWIPDKNKNRIYFHSIDIEINGKSELNEKKLFNHILKEMWKNTQDTMVSYRNNKRWVKCYESLNVERSSDRLEGHLKKQGVYLISGELKGVGFLFIKHLLENFEAKFIVPWHIEYPLRKEWNTWLENHEPEDPISQQIRHLRELENISSDILILRADIYNPNQMQEVVNQGIHWFGGLNGVIHPVYINDYCNENSSQREEPILKRIKQLLILDQISKNLELDCYIFLSSIPEDPEDIISLTINHFMEVMISWQNHTSPSPWIGIFPDALIQKDQILELVLELLSSGESGAFYISKGNINNAKNPIDEKIKNHQSNISTVKAKRFPNNQKRFPLEKPHNLSNNYVSPRDEIENKITEIWEEILGFTQIGIDDNFFDLNGSSLTATQIISRVNELYQVEIPLQGFLANPTIKCLAKQIEDLLNNEV